MCYLGTPNLVTEKVGRAPRAPIRSALPCFARPPAPRRPPAV